MIPQTIKEIGISNILSSAIAALICQGLVVILDSVSAQVGMGVSAVLFSTVNLKYKLWMYGVWTRLIYISIGTIFTHIAVSVSRIYVDGLAFWSVAIFWCVVGSWLIAIIVIHHNGLSIFHHKSVYWSYAYLRLFSQKGRVLIGRIVFGILIGFAAFSEAFLDKESSKSALTVGIIATTAYLLIFTLGEYFIRFINKVHEVFEAWIIEKLEPLHDLESRMLIERSSISLFMAILLTAMSAFASVYYSLDYYLNGLGFSEKVGNPISFFDAFYFSAITAATVGYGDIIPKASIVRAVVVLQVLFSFWLVTFAVNIIVARVTKAQEQGIPDTLISAEDLARAKKEIEG